MYKAATPTTWGVAIEVPEMVFLASLPPIQEEVMSTPGPKISTHLPYEVKEAVMSLLSEAATVKALAAPEGEPSQASTVSSLPAATIKGMFLAKSWAAASSMAWDLPPPSDML